MHGLESSSFPMLKLIEYMLCLSKYNFINDPSNLASLIKTFIGITDWTTLFFNVIMKSLLESNLVFRRSIHIKSKVFCIMPFKISLRIFILWITKHCFCYHNLIKNIKQKIILTNTNTWTVFRKEHWFSEIKLKPLHFKEREPNKNILVAKLELLICENLKTLAASSFGKKAAGDGKAVYLSQRNASKICT